MLNNNSKLYIAGITELLDNRSEDRSVWSELYNNKIIVAGVSLVDRTQKIEFPYGFKLYDSFEMPTDLSNFNLTYDQICDKRAGELLRHSDTTGLPIYLLWSGGIDSTTALVAFLKQREHSKLSNQLIILLNPDSIDENPNFYYNFIRGKFKIESSEHISYIFDGRGIIVGGEHNDQIFGSDIVGRLLNSFPMDIIKQDYRNGIFKEFLKQHGMSDNAANYWFDLLVWHAEQAPCEIKSTFDLIWWLNFSFKWQNVWFRMLLRIDNRFHKNLNPTWIDKHYQHFFTSLDFQKWSMLNSDKKIKDTWASYKFTAKDYIYEYTKDAFYRDNKDKRGSLFRLFIHKNTPIAIDSNWNFLYSVDKEQFYQPVNSFSTNYKNVNLKP